jgi:hypothetical protein
MPMASKKYDKDSVKGKLASRCLKIKRGKNGKRTHAESISIEGRAL